MGRNVLWCVVALLISITTSAQAGDTSARIKIDTERMIGDIHKHIYGNFAEHLGRCIYGGIYDPGRCARSTARRNRAGSMRRARFQDDTDRSVHEKQRTARCQ